MEIKGKLKSVNVRQCFAKRKVDLSYVVNCEYLEEGRNWLHGGKVVATSEGEAMEYCMMKHISGAALKVETGENRKVRKDIDSTKSIYFNELHTELGKLMKDYPNPDFSIKDVEFDFFGTVRKKLMVKHYINSNGAMEGELLINAKPINLDLDQPLPRELYACDHEDAVVVGITEGFKVFLPTTGSKLRIPDSICREKYMEAREILKNEYRTRLVLDFDSSTLSEYI